MIPISSVRGTMKENIFTLSKWKGAIFIFAIVMFGLTGQSYSQVGNSVLLLQQTPAEGGEVAPGVGVHHYEIGSQVTLSAAPRKGYQFVYWIGDVSDPTSNNTMANLDTPKIIIAVFEKSEYDYLPRHENELWAFGSLYTSAVDYKQQGGGGIGGKRPRKPVTYTRPIEPEFPVPVPEPVTGALLGLGSLLFLRNRPRKR